MLFRSLPPPSHLLCDFAEYTDRLFVAGEVVALPVDRRSEMVEQGAAILIHNRRPVFAWAMEAGLGHTQGLLYAHSGQRQVYQSAFRLLHSAHRIVPLDAVRSSCSGSSCSLTRCLGAVCPSLARTRMASHAEGWWAGQKLGGRDCDRCSPPATDSSHGWKDRRLPTLG